jgi:hypothetical protein
MKASDYSRVPLCARLRRVHAVQFGSITGLGDVESAARVHIYALEGYRAALFSVLVLPGEKRAA